MSNTNKNGARGCVLLRTLHDSTVEEVAEGSNCHVATSFIPRSRCSGRAVPLHSNVWRDQPLPQLHSTARKSALFSRTLLTCSGLAPTLGYYHLSELQLSVKGESKSCQECEGSIRGESVAHGWGFQMAQD